MTIESAIANVQAKVGVAARHLETDEEVLHQAADLFFTASTFPVPLRYRSWSNSTGKSTVAP